MLKEKEIMRMLDTDIEERKTLSSYSPDFALLSFRIEALLEVLEYVSEYHYEQTRRDEAMPQEAEQDQALQEDYDRGIDPYGPDTLEERYM